VEMMDALAIKAAEAAVACGYPQGAGVVQVGVIPRTALPSVLRRIDEVAAAGPARCADRAAGLTRRRPPVMACVIRRPASAHRLGHRSLRCGVPRRAIGRPVEPARPPHRPVQVQRQGGDQH